MNSGTSWVRPILIAVALTWTIAVPAEALWTGNPAVNLAVRAAPGDQTMMAAVSDSAGGIVVVWSESFPYLSHYELRAQRVSADGTLLWANDGVLVDSGTTTYDQAGALTGSDGGVYVVWRRAVSSDSFRIFAQHLSSSGDRPWSANPISINAACQGTTIAPLAKADDGGLLIGWTDTHTSSGSTQYNVRLQELNGDGTVAWSPEGVSVCVLSSNQAPGGVSVARDGEGGAYLVWTEAGYGYFAWGRAQRVYADGTLAWDASGVLLYGGNNGLTVPGIAAVPGGGFMVVYGGSDNAYQQWAFVQKVAPTGELVWANGGVRLFSSYPYLYLQGCAADCCGGVVAFCRPRDSSSSDQGARAQKVDVNGVVSWGVSGVRLGDALSWSYFASTMEATSSDLFVLVRDAASTLRAEKIGPDGTKVWGNEPVPVCTVSGAVFDGCAIPDGSGGVIAVWNDVRNGYSDVYAHHIPAAGPVGPEPSIVSVRDVPHDQGGKVKLSWLGSYHDIAPEYGISSYLIWRSVPAAIAAQKLSTGATMGCPETSDAVDSDTWLSTTTDKSGQIIYWEYVGSQIAVGDPGYSYIVPTTSDSLPNANPYTLVRVQARASSGTVYYSSEPDSGYSVDNLTPSRPSNLRIAADNELRWDAAAETDFHHYTVYGSDTGDGTSRLALIAQTTESHYLIRPITYPYLMVTSTDVHQNESEAAIRAAISGVANGDARLLALHGCQPNPFNPRTTIKYDLPEAGAVRLAVFDLAGRLVRTLVDESKPRGSHEAVWDGRDSSGREVGSGTYLARLEFGGRAEVVRMGLVR